MSMQEAKVQEGADVKLPSSAPKGETKAQEVRPFSSASPAVEPSPSTVSKAQEVRPFSSASPSAATPLLSLASGLKRKRSSAFRQLDNQEKKMELSRAVTAPLPVPTSSEEAAEKRRRLQENLGRVLKL